MTIDEPRAPHARDCQHNWTIQEFRPNLRRIDVTHYCPVCDTVDETTLQPTQDTLELLDTLKQREDDPRDTVEHVGLMVDEDASIPYEVAARIYIAYEDGEEETRQDLHHFTPA